MRTGAGALDAIGIARLHEMVDADDRHPAVAGIELVAHRAGNSVLTATTMAARADAVELDVHVLRGRVELRHEKVIHPTTRLWERWYLLPRGAQGVPIDDVLRAVGPATPLMIDYKCFTRRAARMVLASLPPEQPVIVSTRNWWTLPVFATRPDVRLLRSCGKRRQLWLGRLLRGLGGRRGLCVHERLLDRAAIEAIRAKTPLLFVWAAESTERCIELAEAGVTGLILDDLDLVSRSRAVENRSS